jgi:hypothetical protein
MPGLMFYCLHEKLRTIQVNTECYSHIIKDATISNLGDGLHFDQNGDI